MRPVRLELEGFTSFRQRTTIDFADLQVFAITGHNGAGKSSILEAIIFALYGETSRLGSLKKELISQGSSELNVQFEFAMGRTKYRVSRRNKVTGTGSYASLEQEFRDGWKSIKDGETSVDDQICKLIGLPVKAFNQAVIIPQGQFETFLHPEKPRDRIETLIKMFDLEVYRQMQDRASELYKEFSSELTVINQRIEFEFREVTKEKLKALKSDRQELAKNIKTSSETIKELENQIEVMQRIIAIHEDLTEWEERYNSTVATLVNDRRLLDKKRELLATLQSTYRDKAGELKHEIENERIVRNALEELQKTFSSINKLTAKTKEIETSISSMQIELKNAEKAITDYMTKKEAWEKKIKDCGYDEKLYQSLQDKLENFHQYVQSLEKQENLTSEHSEAEAVLNSAKDKQSRIDAKSNELKAKMILVEESIDTAKHEMYLAELYGSVKPGETCPLCGSIISAEKKLKHNYDSLQSEKLLEKKSLEKEQINKALKSLHGEESNLLSTTAEAQKKKESALKILPELQRTINHLAETLRLITKDKSTGSDLVRNLKMLYNTQKKLKPEYDGLVESVEKCERQLQLSQRLQQEKLPEIKSQKEQLSFFNDQLAQSKTKLRQTETHPLIKDRWKGKDSEIDNLIKKSSEKAEESQAALDDLAKSLSLAQSEIARIEGQINKSEAREKDEKEKIKALNKQLAKFDEKDVKLASTNQIKKKLSELDSMRDDQTSMARQEGELETEISEMEEKIKILKSLKAKKEKLDKDQDVYKRLTYYLRSDRLQNYLVSRILRSLTSSANVYLKDITQGKFELVVNAKEDLVVADFWSGGGCRSVKTLSGGETFVISLSLALALSSAVKDGLHLESLFLDEGFGSLDRQRLDLVKDALIQLQQYGKLVGVVTHLEELASAFPKQLRVSNSPEGATVEFH